jgi:mRNA degradation ribonuclease J1/J2
MVSITCYGGANEIGGNKIVVQDGDTCLSFDFGTSFSRRHD